MTQLINLDNVNDRFAVVQELLALKRSNSNIANTDPNQALVFATSLVDAFLDKEVAKLMGIVPTTETHSFTLKEVEIIKKMVATWNEPKQPVYRMPEQPQPPLSEPKTVEQPVIPAPTVPSDVPTDTEAAPAPKPMRMVRRGPNSLPTLSRQQMEATTHTDSVQAGQAIERSFMSLGTKFSASGGQGAEEA